jgi:Cell wall-active antibiotics response 4TMS YvqF
MIVPAEMVPPVRGATAFLSAQVRSGDWILPRLFRGVSVFGDLKLDLTRARFGAGASHIELMVIMGNVTILVPPDVRVDCDGDAIIGAFETEGEKWSTAGIDAPTIRVSGTAFMGSVEIKIVNPNAPSWIKMLRTRWNEARGLSAGQP